MGYCIVKAVQEPADDRYLLWSTIVDGFTFFGTRKQMRKYLVKRWGTDSIPRIDRGLDKADERGSDSGMLRWRWDVISQRMQTESGWAILPRANLGALWDLYDAWKSGDEPDYSHLVTPITDEDN